MFTRSTFQFLSSSLIAMSLLAGCQQKTFGPPPDAKPTPTRTVFKESKDPKLESNDRTPAASDAYASILAQDASFETLRDQVVIPLSQLILAPKNLSSVKITQSQDFYTNLQLYHQALIALALKGEGHEEYAADLTKQFSVYEKVVLAPCFADANSCDALKTVAKDSTYTPVVLDATRILKLSPDRAWAYTFYALDFAYLKTSVNGQKQIFANAEAYLKSLHIEDQGQTKSQTRISDQAAIVGIGLRLSQVASALGGDNPQFQNFIARVDLWSPNGIDPNQKAVHDALWWIVVHTNPNTPSGLNSSFAKWQGRELSAFEDNTFNFYRLAEARAIKDTTDAQTAANKAIAAAQSDKSDAAQKTAKDAQTALQLAQQVEKDATSQRQAWDRVQTSFNLVNSRATDPQLTFIMHELFENKIGLDDAVTLLHYNNAPLSNVLKVAGDYMRLRFAFITFSTHQSLQKALGDSSHYKTVAQLRESLLMAHDMEIQWARFADRVEVLHNFVENTSATDGNMKQADRDSIDSAFGELNRDIKHYVTFPNMLPVMYYISQANLSEGFSFLWFVIVLNSDTIFDMLFKGQLEVWFNFTNSMQDTQAFTAPEVVDAFSNALTTELFTTYKISPSSWLITATDHLLTTTSAQLDQANSSLNDSLYVDSAGDLDNYERSIFKRTVAYCQGKSSEPEILDLKDLTLTLTPYLEEIGSSSSPSSIFTLRLRDGSGSEQWNIPDFTDRLRTDEMYPLQMLEKMRDIYVQYLEHYGMKDDQVPVLDQKLAAIHQRIKKYLGYVYYGYDSMNNCMNFIMVRDRERVRQAMTYEISYLNQSYKDLQSVIDNPSLMDSINSKYAVKYPELPIPDEQLDHDKIVKTPRGYAFIYTRTDFVMRLKSYVQKGMIDPETGVTKPAISPAMVIRIPDNPKKDRLDRYSYFYNHGDNLEIELLPGQGQDVFMKKAYSVHFNQTDYAGPQADNEIKPFNSWYGPWNSVNYTANIFSTGRLNFQGTLMKLGESEVYDFTKSGCDPNAALADLDKNCVVKRSFTAQNAYDSQVQLIHDISMPAEDEAIFKLTKTPSLYGPLTSWHAVFSTMDDRGAIGVLDPYRYMMSVSALGYNLRWPGTPMPKGPDSSTTPYRNGRVDFARTYYEAFDPKKFSLLKVDPSLNSHLKDMYQTFVDQEFGQQNELESLANQKSAQGLTFKLKIETDLPAYTIPILTNYVTPPEIAQNQFNRETEGMFVKTAR